MSLFPVSGETLFLTSAVFAAQNYVLRDGQVGVEADSGRMKIGDGVTEWADLAYVPIESGLSVVDAEAAGTGTDETPGLVSAKTLNGEVGRQIDAIPAMTAQDAEEGISETPMLVSPKVMADEIARQILEAS